MESRTNSERTSDVGAELLKHAERQTQLLHHIARRLNFFHALAWTGFGLLILYIAGVLLFTYLA